MYRHDGSDSARARSARIRADHDYEGTHLESMQRRTSALGERAERASRWRACAAPLARLTRRHAVSRLSDEVSVTDPADARVAGR
jgi:hypothetical protein